MKDFLEIGMKLGCPLSPTLLNLFIDQVEGFIQEALGEPKEKPAIRHF